MAERAGVLEMWRLARALPLAPLREFEKRSRGLPRTTETERLVVQRVGQDVFRAALMDHWGGRCAVALHYIGSDARGTLNLSEEWSVKPTRKLLEELARLVGRDGIRLGYGPRPD